MIYKPSRVMVLREAITKVTQILTGQGLRVIQQGMEAKVEYDTKTLLPRAVYLPMLPENATDELCDAIQGFLDHEVGHVLFTTPAALIEAQKLGEEGASIHNMVEDTFVERKMGTAFRGSESNLDRVRHFYIKHFVASNLAAARKSGDEQKELAVLFPAIIRSLAGQFTFTEFLKNDGSAIADKVMKIISSLAADVEAVNSTAEAVEVTKKIIEKLKQEKPPQPKPQPQPQQKPEKGEKQEKGDKGEPGEPSDEEQEPGQSGDGEPSDPEQQEDGQPADGEESSEQPQPEEGGDQPQEEPGEEEGDIEGEGQGDGDGEEEDDSEGEGGGQPGEQSDTETPQDRENSLSSDPVPDEEAASETQDGAGLTWAEIAAAVSGVAEYDDAAAEVMGKVAAVAARKADYLVYSTEYDEVKPLAVPSYARDQAITDCGRYIEDKVSAMVAPMQKDLERAMAARSASTNVGGFRSGRLNGPSLVRLKFGDDRVFRRKTENHTKDVVASLVVDISGSMSGAKVMTACQAAFALSSVLERIGIKHEIICFTTGRQICDYSEQQRAKSQGILYARTENLIMPIIKSFDETLNSEVRARFGRMPTEMPMHSNIDGESIERAAHRLMKRKASRHVMIVLSDGEPAGHSMAGREVLLDDLGNRVKKLERAGIDIVGIGIESAAVKKFYSKNVVINRVTELPGTVMRKLRDLLIPK